MFYKRGYAEHPTITRVRALINFTQTHDDLENLKVARGMLDALTRAQAQFDMVEQQLEAAEAVAQSFAARHARGTV